MQEKDIADNLCTRVIFKGVVGQADRPQQVGVLGQVFSDLGIPAVQGVTGCEKRYDTAGAKPSPITVPPSLTVTSGAFSLVSTAMFWKDLL